MIYLFIYGNYVCIANCQQLFFQLNIKRNIFSPFTKSKASTECALLLILLRGSFGFF